MNRARVVIVLIILVVLAITLAGAFLTRGVMAYLPFLQARKGNWTGAYVARAQQLSTWRSLLYKLCK